MKALVCYSHLFIIFTILVNIDSKSVYDDPKFRDDSEVKLYPVKRKPLNYEHAYYLIAHEEQPDAEYADTLSNLEGSPAQRYYRTDDQAVANNLQPLGDYKPAQIYERPLELRRPIMQNGANRRADKLTKRESDDSYGMVYRKGRLVGILEPYPPAYELAPLSNIREGIEEIQPLPMSQSSMRQGEDGRYANNKLLANKLSANWDWGKPESLQDSAKYVDEKYPMILTDFKIDSKMSNSNSIKRDNLRGSMLTGKKSEKNVKLKPISTQLLKSGNEASNNEKSASAITTLPLHKEPDSQFQSSGDPVETKLSSDVKRSVPGITDEKISELKSTLDKIQNPESPDKVEAIEEDLRGILNDMGLIENDASKNKRSSENQDATDKRQVDKEDENLEQGANKIEIVKTTDPQSGSREKRDESKESQNKGKVEKLANQDAPENNNPEFKASEESPDVKSENNANLEPDSEKQPKPETEANGDMQENNNIKRGALKINVANYQNEGEAYIRNKRQESSTELNDIMKGLEKSGELTVSGNKSPLASAGSGPEAPQKRTDNCPCTTMPSMLKTDRNEVKYETDIERSLQEKIDAIKEEVKREIAELQAKNADTAKETQENQRKKRDAAATLLEEETSAVNPQEHPEEKLVPYIRRRRNLEGLEDLNRPKRGLPDFSNLKNIDTGDYLNLYGDKKRDDHDILLDYQMDPQENKYLPQNIHSSIENSRNADNSVEKRNTAVQQQEPDAVPLNADDTENANYQVPKIKEKRMDDSSDSSQAALPKTSFENTPVVDIENGLKPASAINKRQESSEEDGNKNLESANNRSPANIVEEEHVQQNIPNSENLENYASVQDDVQKRQSSIGDDASSKNVINTVADQQFNQELKKLTEQGSSMPNSDTITTEMGNVANEAKKEKAQDIYTKEAEMSKTEVKLTPNHLAHVSKNKHVKDASSKEATNSINKNLKAEVKSKRKWKKIESQAKQEANVQEPLRRRRQVEEEGGQNKPQITYRRRKRANAALLEGNVAYLPYRADEEEVDDEGDEFEDDGFDDRTASMQKRDISYNNQFRRAIDYDNVQEYEMPDGYSLSNYQPEYKNPLARRYVARLNPDVYENPSPGYAGNYLYHPEAYIRRKRQDFDQLASLHGGGPMLHHLAAVRERNIQQLDNQRNNQKRSWKANNQNNKEEPQNIADLSDTDIFGALPQSYEGELSRFKRVKRAGKNVKENP